MDLVYFGCYAGKGQPLLSVCVFLKPQYSAYYFCRNISEMDHVTPDAVKSSDVILDEHELANMWKDLKSEKNEKQKSHFLRKFFRKKVIR